MADKCSICKKRSGSYKVKDGAICGKCYGKYTKAGYEFKKKLTVSEIEEAIRDEEAEEATREYKREDLVNAKGLLYIWAAGFLVGIVGFVILWADFLGFLLLSLFCFWMGKSDLDEVVKVLRRKKNSPTL